MYRWDLQGRERKTVLQFETTNIYKILNSGLLDQRGWEFIEVEEGCTCIVFRNVSLNKSLFDAYKFIRHEKTLKLSPRTNNSQT